MKKTVLLPLLLTLCTATAWAAHPTQCNDLRWDDKNKKKSVAICNQRIKAYANSPEAKAKERSMQRENCYHADERHPNPFGEGDNKKYLNSKEEACALNRAGRSCMEKQRKHRIKRMKDRVNSTDDSWQYYYTRDDLDCCLGKGLICAK